MKNTQLLDILQTNYFTLPYLPISEKDKLPNVVAIYFVVDNEELVYIGKSTNLHKRWNCYEHHVTMLLTDNACLHWLVVNKNQLDLIEALLIPYHEPKFNKGVPTVKQEKGGFSEQDLTDAYNLGLQKGIVTGVAIGKASKNEYVNRSVSRNKFISVDSSDESVQYIASANSLESNILEVKFDKHVECSHCKSTNLIKKGKSATKRQLYQCKDCNRKSSH